MKTKTTKQPRTIKLRTVQSGIEAELRSIIKTNLTNPASVADEGTFNEHKGGITAIVPMRCCALYRQGLRDAIKVVNAQFESYR
jgi:hypothetical protein